MCFLFLLFYFVSPQISKVRPYNLSDNSWVCDVVTAFSMSRKYTTRMLNEQQMQELTITLNEQIEMERKIFSTKSEEMENNFQNEMSKKSGELDELRRNLDVSLDDNKTKMLQQTIQNLTSEVRELKKKVEETMPVRLRWTKAHMKEETEEAYWNDKVEAMAKAGAKCIMMRVVAESGLVLGAVGGDDEEDDFRRGEIVFVALDKLKEWQAERDQRVRTGNGAGLPTDTGRVSVQAHTVVGGEG